MAKVAACLLHTLVFQNIPYIFTHLLFPRQFRIWIVIILICGEMNYFKNIQSPYREKWSVCFHLLKSLCISVFLYTEKLTILCFNPLVWYILVEIVTQILLPLYFLLGFILFLYIYNLPSYQTHLLTINPSFYLNFLLISWILFIE